MLKEIESDAYSSAKDVLFYFFVPKVVLLLLELMKVLVHNFTRKFKLMELFGFGNSCLSSFVLMIFFFFFLNHGL